MTAVKGSVEIARDSEEVFDYAADPAHRSEWQESVSDVHVETPGPTAAGTRVNEMRQVTGGPRRIRWSYTRFDPKRGWSFGGIDGPVRPIGSMAFSSADDGDNTRVDMEIDFAGHGLGRLFVPLARRDARKQVPRDLAALKRELEGRAAAH